MKLQELQPDARVRGILPDAVVTVVNVEWHGSEALTLVYRGPNGRVSQYLAKRLYWDAKPEDRHPDQVQAATEGLLLRDNEQQLMKGI